VNKNCLLKMIRNLLVILICLALVIICKAESLPKCNGDVHQFEFDDSNRIIFGFVEFDLAKTLIRNGSKLEILFEFENLPVNPDDIPALNLTLDEELILKQDSIVSIRCEIFYNLQRKVPKIKRIAWISTEKSKTICENIDKQDFGIYVRMFPQLLLEHQALVDSSKSHIYKCFSRDSGTCKFNGLSLTEINPYFHPESDVPAESVEAIHLTGRMHTLTSDICDKFPNLRSFNAYNIYLKQIHADAFSNCKKLEYLRLYNNNLTSIPENLLETNTMLKNLRLDFNQLGSIDENIFKNLFSLKSLALDHNKLINFPLSDMPILNTVTELWLNENNLKHISAADIRRKFPNVSDPYL